MIQDVLAIALALAIVVFLAPLLKVLGGLLVIGALHTVIEVVDAIDDAIAKFEWRIR